MFIQNIPGSPYGISPYDVEYLPNFMFGKRADKEYL